MSPQSVLARIKLRRARLDRRRFRVARGVFPLTFAVALKIDGFPNDDHSQRQDAERQKEWNGFGQWPKRQPCNDAGVQSRLYFRWTMRNTLDTEDSSTHVECCVGKKRFTARNARNLHGAPSLLQVGGAAGDAPVAALGVPHSFPTVERFSASGADFSDQTGRRDAGGSR